MNTRALSKYRKLCPLCKVNPPVRRDVMGTAMWLHDSVKECKAAKLYEEAHQAAQVPANIP